MSKKSVIMCVLTILMIAYMGYALPLTARMARQAHVTGMTVRLSDPMSRFVNTSDVIAESGLDPSTLRDSLCRTFDLDGLEQRLLASDKLQDANVTHRSDGRNYVDVTPMVPVARVFDPKEPSYYINSTGKRIRAELRYHIDVPVLVGSFDSIHPAKRLLPLLDKIAGDPRIGSMVATVTQEPDGNIILIPTIVGHVINFGDTSMVDDKFDRLRRFYIHVSPTKGWEAYDTIAVKWRDRVVATRRNKQIAPLPVPTEDEASGILDIDDNEPQPGDSITHLNTHEL